MALEVAAILDETALKREWADSSCVAMNSSLSRVKVASGYNILVTIADRSYLFVSNEKGVLSVAIVPIGSYPRALARANCRVIISADALGNFEQQADMVKLLQKRKMRFDGDAAQLKDFERDISPHINMLRESVEAAGPGSHTIKTAIDEHNGHMTEQKFAQEQIEALEKESMQLALPGQYDAAAMTLLVTVRGWLHFSATSTMSGNVGQGNYCQANALLDQHTFQYRTSDAIRFEPNTIMWGAVGGLGMRWKAFASQDQLRDVGEVLMTAEEARTIVSYMVQNNGLAAEWSAAQKFPKIEGMTWHETLLILNGNPNERKSKDPWRFGKGKGGGLTMAEDMSEMTFHDVQLPKAKHAGSTEASERSWLAPGRRMRIHGLSTHSEMNDVKGTLVEEIKPGVWHVRLDDGWGDKQVKVENLMQVHSSAVKPSPSCTAVTEASTQEPMCIAGTWSDWMPQNMSWDSTNKYYTVDVKIGGAQAAYFGVNKGEAGDKPWKQSGFFKKYGMGHVRGSYRIQVYVKDCRVDDVKWERVQA